MTCACGQPLLAPASIASGTCSHCALHGPAPAGSRAPTPARGEGPLPTVVRNRQTADRPDVRRCPGCPLHPCYPGCDQ